jgi:hypothetical protein
MEPEVWKPIPGFEGLYDVSNTGKVQSYRIRGMRTKPLLIPVLTLSQVLRGKYYVVSLGRGGGRIKRYGVHRLVLEAFIGPCPEGMECCHNDGNPKNNSIDNLRWDTHINNVKDFQNYLREEANELYRRRELSIVSSRRNNNQTIRTQQDLVGETG